MHAANIEYERKQQKFPGNNALAPIPNNMY